MASASPDRKIATLRQCKTTHSGLDPVGNMLSQLPGTAIESPQAMTDIPRTPRMKPSPPRGFATSEYRARTAAAQAAMARQNLDGLLLTLEPDVRYFSGFRTLFWQSPTRPWFLFVPATGAPIAVIPEIGAPLMRQTWIEDIRSWSAPNPADDGISLLVDLLSPCRRIGLPMGHETHLRMPLGDWTRLCHALPDASFEDATALVQDLRMVKSEAEIDKIRHICRIASDTFARVPDFAQTGTPLAEVFREFRRAALALGADDAPYLVGAAGPDGYGDVISPPTDRPLASGDVMMLDTGLTWDGYFCDFDRNWAIGAASDAARRAHEHLWQATEAGLAAARPGQPLLDVFAAMVRVLSPDGAQTSDIGRLGHGLGMQLTEQPSLAGFDATILRENMVLTLEPSLAFGDGLMMVHEENIVIRGGGPELLSRRACRELPVI